MNQTVAAGMRDDGRFGDGGMSEQSIFDFAGRNPHAGNLHHVVGTATVAKKSGFITDEFISREHPFALFRACGEFRLIPISGESAAAANPEISDLAVSDFRAVIAENFCIAAGNFAATASGASLTRARGQAHMEHFRRTDTVKNFHAKRASELLE